MTKNKTKSVNRGPQRDRNGKFVSSRIVPGAFYQLNKGKTSLIVRARKFTQNKMVLVDYKNLMYRLVWPSELKNVSKTEVNRLLNA